MTTIKEAAYRRRPTRKTSASELALGC